MFGPRPNQLRNPPFGGLFNRRMIPSPPTTQMIQHTSPQVGNGFMEHRAQGKAGGILARLFNRSNYNPSSMPFSGTGSFPPSFPRNSLPLQPTTLNVAKTGGGLNTILGFLENAQKSLEVVQTIAPMVQQYGPLVKSLPEIISLFSEQDENSDEEDNNEDVDTLEEADEASPSTTNEADNLMLEEERDTSDIIDQQEKIDLDNNDANKKKSKTTKNENLTNKKNKSNKKRKQNTKKQEQTKSRKKETFGEVPPPKLYI